LLDDFARLIRAGLAAARKDRCNALHHDLDVGDALNAAQQRVTTGWKRWVREHCFLSVRTALLYQRLARHRAEIEAEIERVGELSLRAAVRLIAGPSRSRSQPKPSLVTAIKRATNAERTEAFAALGLMPFLRAMPADWRPQLKARLRSRGEPVLDDDDLRVSDILRFALSHIKIAQTPPITPSVAAGHENQAIEALRGLFKLITKAGLDLNDVAIVRSSARREKKRAA
jgi:hypothetical protein